ncbi:hypothetical protein HSB1_06060 [Halogranum salarium B-1]|uniref:Uncharacterized protein n=1 Tax=Halogranum salarium B-1 TaxID=1210908 RepID=J2ZLE1_9EURY|nr:hypothetical protein HSB1_06060 [Halogranum salarium B-1]
MKLLCFTHVCRRRRFSDDDSHDSSRDMRFGVDGVTVRACSSPSWSTIP